MPAREWEVEQTDQFGDWFEALSEDDQEEIAARVDKLVEFGPGLGRPLVDTVTQSATPNMKELRCGSIRILFCFDPRQVAILLIGGDKRDRWSEWYREFIPVADELYECYLDELRQEGLL